MPLHSRKGLIDIAAAYRKDLKERNKPVSVLEPITDIIPPQNWFHSIDFGDGVVSRGSNPLFRLKGMADLAFRYGVKDKSVLDIGAWDGFYSFEAERRGASKVLSTDHYCWSGAGWGNKDGYDYAHARLSSKCESIDADVFQLIPTAHGTFDVVLFLGVLYHLGNPFEGLKRAADMTNDMLVIETVTSCNFMPIPLMRFYLEKELNDDPTNFWAPNTLCLKRMLRRLGFNQVEICRNPYSIPSVSRHFAFARR